MSDKKTKLLSKAAAEMGIKGGEARAAALSAERRSEIARLGAAKRWSKAKKPKEEEAREH